MISEIETEEYPAQYQSYRHAIVSLKPKRRFKHSELRLEPKVNRSAPPPEEKPTVILRPVFSSGEHHERMKRSGRPNPILRRVIAPVEFSRAMPQLPKSVLLRRIIDFLKLWQFGNMMMHSPAGHRGCRL